MRTVYQFIMEAIEAGDHTEASIARLIGVSKQRLNILKNKPHGSLPPEAISILADLLNIDPIVIHASIMYHQCEKNKTREYWRSLPSRVLLAGFGQVASTG